MALCNADEACRVAGVCASHGLPFMIALPTYRHAVSYGKNGKITQVASEGNYQSAKYELAKADPVELSKLIVKWEKSRPKLMQGVIWYRLPVRSDRMNWTWETLQKVRRGNFKKQADLEIKMQAQTNGLYRLNLTNNSKQRLDWPEKLHLNWEGKSFCIAHETKNYHAVAFERSKGIALQWNQTTPYPLAPGESISCGWFRFSEKIPPQEIIITNPQ